MAKYAALVGSASEGAVTTGRRMTAGLSGLGRVDDGGVDRPMSGG